MLQALKLVFFDQVLRSIIALPLLTIQTRAV